MIYLLLKNTDYFLTSPSILNLLDHPPKSIQLITLRLNHSLINLLKRLIKTDIFFIIYGEFPISLGHRYEKLY